MKPCIYVHTPTRAADPTRWGNLAEVIAAGRAKAGMPIDHWVVDCAMAPPFQLDGAEARVHSENVGQHFAWNRAYADAVARGATYFVRVDDDCIFETRAWLRKLVKASQRLNDRVVLAPHVKGLSNPLPTKHVNHCGVQLDLITDLAIGGVCRFHPMAVLANYVADVRKPLGSGDATSIAKYCHEKDIDIAYLSGVFVQHDTVAQIEAQPAYHAVHDVLQHVPFIPRGAALPLDSYVAAQRSVNAQHKDGALENATDVDLVKQVIAMLPYAPKRALSIGCRFGYELREMRAAWPSARVVGIDIVPDFVQRAAHLGYEAHCGDMHALPFANGEFDFVYCAATLEHALDAAQAAREMLRVCNGLLYVTADLIDEASTVNVSHETRHADPAWWASLFSGAHIVQQQAIEGSVHFLIDTREASGTPS